MNIIKKMDKPSAVEIAAWVYEGELAVYNLHGTSAAVEELLNDNYYVSVDPTGKIVGFYCYGDAARIPVKEADVYKEGPLDIGLGLNPDIMGQGLGKRFVRAGISFAENKFHVTQFRLTVAAFNKRAINTYQKEGFIRIKTVAHGVTGAPFYVMACVL